MTDARTPILVLFNAHSAPTDPIPTQPSAYVAYFENLYGEQLVFVQAPGRPTATLSHGDLDWKPVVVRDGQVEAVLSRQESTWLGLCWKAAHRVRASTQGREGRA